MANANVRGKGPETMTVMGGEPPPTNNRMELTAAIRGLEAHERALGAV